MPSNSRLQEHSKWDTRRKGVEWALEHVGLTLYKMRSSTYHATGEKGRYRITAWWDRPDQDKFELVRLAKQTLGEFDYLLVVELDEAHEVRIACELGADHVKSLARPWKDGDDTGELGLDILPLLQHKEELASMGARLFDPNSAFLDDWQLTDPGRPRVPDEVLERQRLFAKRVLAAYGHACAACRSDVSNTKGRNWVQACHIRPVKDIGSDHLCNGIALCPSHHWAFDEGLMTLDPDGHWIASKQVPRECQYKFVLDLQGNQAFLPGSEQRPHPEALTWHRLHVFVDREKEPNRDLRR